nr:NADH dehydrogenase subunit 1 [Hypoaspis sp. 3 JO-2023a]
MSFYQLVMSLFFLKIFFLICILINVAFITLLERKILGYIQLRKGPNKNFFLGLLQPFNDAIKLLSKEYYNLSWFNQLIFFISPFMCFILMIFFWMIFTFNCSLNMNFHFSLILILIISSLNIYPIIFSGWSSNSKYATFGSYRNVAQTISYEVSFSFIILATILFAKAYDIFDSFNLQFNSFHFFIGNSILFFSWLVIILAETNRSPLDFAESESELVSGFNIEYGGIGFTILFLAEYGNIIFMSWLTSLLFFYTIKLSIFLAIIILILTFFLWVRGTFVRFRYDNLMMLAWKIILPFSMLYLILVFLFFFIF